MQSPLPLPKLFLYAFVATSYLAISSTLAVAQVYQVRPDGSLISPPRYLNPNFRQYTAQPPIYPGQIINGERVIEASVPTPPLGSPRPFVPPQPPATNSDRQNQKATQQIQRPKTALRTSVPIPAGPALEPEPSSTSVADWAPSATGAVNIETPLNSESSIDTEEKIEPTEPTETQISSSEQLPTLEPPISETPLDDSAIAPADIDEDIMAEIKQIRAQLGGGIAETLKEIDQMPGSASIKITPSQDSDAATSAKEISPEDLFNEELRSVMSEQESKQDAIIGAPRTLRLPRTANSPAQLPYADRTQELRNCARELEQLAGRLEAIAAYEPADQIRRQAAQLWTTARER